MNKNRMILAATGGVVALAVLGMAGLVWNAHSGKVAALEGDFDEGVDGLETVLEKAQRLSRGQVYPCEESVKAVKANTEKLADWRKEALQFAARGDRPVEKTTPPAFKAFLVQDAKRIASLRGSVNGALVQPDFAFGPFKDYISEGKMPPEAKLAELQRRWDDVATLAETLSECGIDELVSVDFRDGSAEAKQKEEAEQQRGPRRKPRGKKPAAEENSFKPSAFGYAVVFRARPNALVKSLNAFATSERFVVVDSVSFDRARDGLSEALGGEEKKAEAAQTGGRRRRRRGGDEPSAAQASAEDSAAKGGIVTDPVLDAPFTVSLAVTVYDFGSLADDAAAKGDGAAKEEKGAAR